MVNNLCLIDLPTGDQLSITMLNQLLDPYPLSLEIKGAFTAARYTKVFILSNDSPAVWYRAGFGNVTQNQVAALLRRLNVFFVRPSSKVRVLRYGCYDTKLRKVILANYGITYVCFTYVTSSPTTFTYFY